MYKTIEKDDFVLIMKDQLQIEGDTPKNLRLKKSLTSDSWAAIYDFIKFVYGADYELQPSEVLEAIATYSSTSDFLENCAGVKKHASYYSSVRTHDATNCGVCRYHEDETDETDGTQFIQNHLNAENEANAGDEVEVIKSGSQFILINKYFLN